MIARWARNRGVLRIGDLFVTCRSDVRSYGNGRRKLHDPGEVVRAIVNGAYSGPYMPSPFPVGTWKIIGTEKSKKIEFAPVKILTNARQPVQLWKLDNLGGYEYATDEWVEDSGYWLHYSRDSKTTLGCGRIGSAAEALMVADLVKKILAAKEDIILEVTAE
jgi:hypothetical protein